MPTFDNGLDVARRVVQTSTAHLFKVADDGKYESIFYTARTDAQAKAEGWILLDLYTASAIIQIHSALKPENQRKFETETLITMAHIAFALLRKVGE